MVKPIYVIYWLLWTISISPLIYAQNNSIINKEDQDTKAIRITADRLEINQKKYPDATLLSKIDTQVYMKHEGLELWCDKAIHYQKKEFVKASGNIKIKQGDSIQIVSKYAEYNGKKGMAFMSSGVNLKTPKNKLTTDTLFFDRKKQEAFFRSGGIIKDPTNTLKSDVGSYDLKKKVYRFKNKVEVKNLENNIKSDHLYYNTNSENVYLYGPSVITGKNSELRCERGFFDTRRNRGYATKNAQVYYKNRVIKGDSIFYDNQNNFASASNHIEVIDTINKSLIRGHYAEVFRKKDSLFITKNPVAITTKSKDSTFILSDTLMVTGKTGSRKLRAFKNVHIWNSKYTGKCDSIIVFQKEQLNKLIGKPIFWIKNTQITGDEILISSRNNKLDSLKIPSGAFITEKDTLNAGFNQVKGKNLFGSFKNNNLSEIQLNKNTETIYFQRDRDLNLIGINKITSGSIKIILQKKELTDMYYYDNVDGTLFLEENLTEEERILEGLNWRIKEKPISKTTLFKSRPSLKLPKIKGIEYLKNRF